MSARETIRLLEAEYHGALREWTGLVEIAALLCEVLTGADAEVHDDLERVAAVVEAMSRQARARHQRLRSELDHAEYLAGGAG